MEFHFWGFNIGLVGGRTDFQELPEEDAAPSLSYSTTETLSWMREAGVDADIYSYARGRLLNRDEYFFKVWHQTQQIHEGDEGGAGRDEGNLQ